MSELVLSYLDVTKLAVTSFLARYRQPTLGSYQVDLRCYLRWCTEVGVDPLRVTRAQLEQYVRALEAAEYAPATIARRFCTVATFLKLHQVRARGGSVAARRPHWRFDSGELRSLRSEMNRLDGPGHAAGQL